MLFITDKKGRIQYNRSVLFQKMMPKLNIDIITIGENFNPKKYNLIYYTSYKIFRRMPCKQKCIASVTSHKGLRKKSLKECNKLLKKFVGISVNNLHLYKKYRKYFPNVYYTPNGVDTDFFSFIDKKKKDKVIFGWVGNKDRSEKNYEKVLKPLKQYFKKDSYIKFRVIAPSKSDKVEKLLTKEQMRDYYHSLDFFLITSTTEGTPNPGLEAMSCGVPVITTKVGNMTEIVTHGLNGFYADAEIDSFIKMIERVSSIDQADYMYMRKNTRKEIEKDWSWNIRYNNWKAFFMDFV